MKIERLREVIKIIVRELVPQPSIVRLKRLYLFLKRCNSFVFSSGALVRIRRLFITELLPVPTIERLLALRQKLCKGFHITSNSLAKSAERATTNNKQATENNKQATDIVSIIYQGKEYSSIDAYLGANKKLNSDIVVCCAFLGRYDLLRLVIQEGLSTKKSRVCFCLAGSSESDKQYLLSLSGNDRVIGVITRNEPVGKKWQMSINVARALVNYELIGITGSDDILTHVLLDNVLRKHRDNISKSSVRELVPVLYATLEWMIFAIGDKQEYLPQLVHCNYRLQNAVQPIGGGRFYSKEFIEQVWTSGV